MRPVIVGIPACVRMVNGAARHDTPARYAAAVVGAAGALTVMIPPLGAAQAFVLDRLDGLLLPGSPSNVHPDHYAGGASLRVLSDCGCRGQAASALSSVRHVEFGLNHARSRAAVRCQQGT